VGFICIKVSLLKIQMGVFVHISNFLNLELSHIFMLHFKPLNAMKLVGGVHCCEKQRITSALQGYGVKHTVAKSRRLL